MKLPTEGTLRRIAVFAAAFGIGVATYIAIATAGGDAPACIAGEGGCEKVTDSSHSELLGIDVAVIGVIGYVLLLVAALLRGDGARMAGFGFALFGFGFSVYLTYLELFRIDAVCQWCVASAVSMTVLFAVNTMRMLWYVGRPDG
ncbi:MAG TPA: vitamin K epoxide reductase family protein [Solirubrobacterales bacterium]|nr:vitamin K epoxide reductase family protein [Solirubrobacterales bacterium]